MFRQLSIPFRTFLVTSGGTFTSTLPSHMRYLKSRRTTANGVLKRYHCR